MKIVSTILILFLSSTTYTQVSVSLGLNRRSENFHNASDHFKTKSKNSRYTNDYYNLKIDYKWSWFSITTELDYLFKKELDFDHNDSYSQGGGFWSDKYTEAYSAKASYDYVGLKLGANIVFKGQSWIFKNGIHSLYIGPTAQTDFLVNHDERDHYQRHTINGSATTSEEEFDALKVAEMHFALGFRLGLRLTVKQIFIEFNGTYGYADDHRTDLNIGKYNSDDYRSKPHFFETGLLIGYTFPENIDKTETK